MRNKGTVQLDAREDSGGRMQTRFLVVEVSTFSLQLDWLLGIQFFLLQIDNMLRNTVVVVDNRGALWTQGAALGGSEPA